MFVHNYQREKDHPHVDRGQWQVRGQKNLSTSVESLPVSLVVMVLSPYMPQRLRRLRGLTKPWRLEVVAAVVERFEVVGMMQLEPR